MTENEHDARKATIADIWHYYDENATQARQHENLRGTASTVLAGFAAALVGFVGVGGVQSNDLPASILVVGIGMLGALLSLKHYEKNRFHTAVLKAARDEIDRLRDRSSSSSESLSRVRAAGKAQHRTDFQKSWLVRIPAHWLWAALHLLVAAVGILLIVLAAT